MIMVYHISSEPMTEDEELSEAQWNEAGFNGVSDSTADLPAPPPGELYLSQSMNDRLLMK
jgi:hypothetical protein